MLCQVVIVVKSSNIIWAEGEAFAENANMQQNNIICLQFIYLVPFIRRNDSGRCVIHNFH